MEPIFTDDKTMRMLNVTHKLHKVLQREGCGYQSEFHRRIGVGLTPADFAVCVKMLEVTDCLSVSKGDRDAIILTFNDAVNNIVVPETPDEVQPVVMG